LLISVIIPTRDRPAFLAEAVLSVLAQSYAELELLIVNDGAMPLPEFSDARIHILNSGQSGAVPARNLGVAFAKGKAIAWLDDDDAWTDVDFLKRCIELLNSGSDFIFGDGALVFPDGTQKTFAKHADAETLQHDNTILISAVCYRRDLHSTLGEFDLALPYYWDWDWYLRVARARAVMTHLESCIVNIRIHAQNMSGDANFSARQDNLNLLCRKHRLSEIPLKSHIDFV
jgi:glycosyltransferase involved in cell wall biosynthesis